MRTHYLNDAASMLADDYVDSLKDCDTEELLQIICAERFATLIGDPSLVVILLEEKIEDITSTDDWDNGNSVLARQVDKLRDMLRAIYNRNSQAQGVLDREDK
jgi:hypothetical protein